MPKLILLILILIAPGIASAQPPPGYTSVSDIAAFRKKMSETTGKISSVKADFTQEKNLEAIEETVISKGSFRFQRPGKIRMEYSSPYKYLLVINGEKITIRDERKTSSFSTRGNRLFTIINNIILDCMQGTALDNRDFKSTVYRNETHYLIVMVPVKKELKDYFGNIRIHLDMKNMDVTRLDMNEPSGDQTKILFTNRDLNGHVSENDFVVK